MGARDEDTGERYFEVYNEEKRKIKRCIHQSKEVQEQCERKKNQGVNVNRKLCRFLIKYAGETKIWREMERSRIRAVQINNLRGLLGIRRMDKVPNARIRQLCRLTKGVDEKIDESVLQEWQDY